MRMLADHADIRARIADIRESLSRTFDSGPIIELGRMLHDHVRLEEDHIFPRMEKALSEIELKSVGSHLTRLHERVGSEIFHSLPTVVRNICQSVTHRQHRLRGEQ